jgi:integrase
LECAQQAGAKADSTPDEPILGRSAQALSAWLEAAGIRAGAIFRRLWKGRIGPALLPGSVAAIVKRQAALAGLEGDFGAHSLRSRFVTEAGKQGVPLPAVMAMTEHRSVASVIGYFRSGQAENNPAARLLK